MFRGFGHPRKGQDDMARRFARALGVITAGVMALGVLLPATASAADSIYWSQESGSGSIRFGSLTGSPPPAQTLLNDGGLPCGIDLTLRPGRSGRSTGPTGTAAPTASCPRISTALVPRHCSPSLGTSAASRLIPRLARSTGPTSVTNEIWRGNERYRCRASEYTDLPNSAPSGVAIDPANNALYWTNQFSDEVRVGSLDGSDPAQTLFGPLTGEDNPIGVAVYSGKVYWTNLYTGEVRSGNVNGLGDPETLFTSPLASGPSIDPWRVRSTGQAGTPTRGSSPATLTARSVSRPCSTTREHRSSPRS